MQRNSGMQLVKSEPCREVRRRVLPRGGRAASLFASLAVSESPPASRSSTPSHHTEVQ